MCRFTGSLTVATESLRTLKASYKMISSWKVLKADDSRIQITTANTTKHYHNAMLLHTASCAQPAQPVTCSLMAMIWLNLHKQSFDVAGGVGSMVQDMRLCKPEQRLISSRQISSMRARACSHLVCSVRFATSSLPGKQLHKMNAVMLSGEVRTCNMV